MLRTKLTTRRTNVRLRARGCTPSFRPFCTIFLKPREADANSLSFATVSAMRRRSKRQRRNFPNPKGCVPHRHAPFFPNIFLFLLHDKNTIFPVYLFSRSGIQDLYIQKPRRLKCRAYHSRRHSLAFGRWIDHIWYTYNWYSGS